MTDVAYVREHFPLRNGVSVHLIAHHDEASYIDRPSGWNMERTRLTEDQSDPEPSFALSESMARALMEALAAHFGGVSETQTLRKDYEAERARVDRLIGHLIR